MVILLDCRPLQYEATNGEKPHFIISCVDILSREKGTEWLFLTDKSYREGFLPGIAPERLIRRKTMAGKAGWKIWYDWQLPRVVKKYSPDLLMTIGSKQLSRVSVPQYQLVWEGLTPGADIKGVGALPLAERERVKQDHAGGKEYFLVSVEGVGPEKRIGLLKAFSRFKKRQQSNMQLILVGKGKGKEADFADKLDSYKYREDLHFYDHLPGAEWEEVLRAAYAFLFPFPGGSLGIPVLNAWKAGVPVIMGNAGPLTGMAGDAVLYAQSDDPDSLAAQLMLVYKDEAVRNSLIQKGVMREGELSWERSADQLWEGILKVIGEKNQINR